MDILKISQLLLSRLKTFTADSSGHLYNLDLEKLCNVQKEEREN